MTELNSTLEMINLNVKVEGTRVCKHVMQTKRNIKNTKREGYEISPSY